MKKEKNILVSFLLSDKRDEVERFCNDPNQENPWLATLKEHIMIRRRPDLRLRCLVFASSREVCAALAEWAKNTSELCDLNPDFLTGANATAQQKGISYSTGGHPAQ